MRTRLYKNFLGATYLHQLVDDEVLGQVVEHAVGGDQDDVAILHGEVVGDGGVGSVAEHVLLVSGRRQRQLERGVEVVLLLLGAVNHAASSHHHEAAIADVGRVQGAVFLVEEDHACRTAAWKIGHS